MKRFLWLIPLLAAAAAYSIAPWGELVWDDDIVVSQQLVAVRTSADVLRPPPGIPQWSYVYYRPVTVLSYLLDQRLFGSGAAAGPHAMNVLYHLITTALVWLLARRMLRHLANGGFGALAAATLFAVHPIHTESVSWITGRSDMLATLLLIPAVLVALRWRDRGSIWALLLSPILFLLALLAKEVAAAGLAILLLLWLTVSRLGAATETAQHPSFRSTTSFIALATGWVAALSLYLALRQATAITPLLAPIPPAEFLWQSARAAAWYGIKLIVPWPQSNFVGSDALPGVAATLTVPLIGTAALIFAAWRWRASRDGALFLGLWWTGVAIAPSLAAIVPGIAETPVAERYLYLPSVGIALALGALLGGAWTAQRLRTVAWGTGIVAAIGLAATLQRGSIWLTNLRLWSDTTSKVATWGMPWVELGRARYGRGDQAGALEAFLHALDLSNSPKTAAIANFNVGLLYAQRGNMPEAEREFAAAVGADPTYARGHYGLGRAIYERALAGAARGRPAAERLAQLRQAGGELALAVSLAPTYVDGHVALAWILSAQGDAYHELGDARQARSSYMAALSRLDAAISIDDNVAYRPDVEQLRRAVRRSLQ